MAPSPPGLVWVAGQSWVGQAVLGTFSHPLSSEANAGTAGLGGPLAGPNSSFSLSGAQLAFGATVQSVCPSIPSRVGHREPREHTRPAQEVSDVPYHLHSSALIKLLPSRVTSRASYPCIF